MSVLIKGMEMPTGHGVKCICIFPDGKVANIYDSDKKQIATAVHVPPHGRLIEKHDVFKLISAFPEIDKLLTVEFMTALYNLPTIIEAEETAQKEGRPDE